MSSTSMTIHDPGVVTPDPPNVQLQIPYETIFDTAPPPVDARLVDIVHVITTTELQMLVIIIIFQSLQ